MEKLRKTIDDLKQEVDELKAHNATLQRNLIMVRSQRDNAQWLADQWHKAIKANK